jgi:uncharacterized protein YbcI
MATGIGRGRRWAGVPIEGAPAMSIEEAPVERGSARSAIANTIVRLHAEHYGRGPTRARAHIADDFVLVVLEDVFTTAERTLVANGHGEQVVAARDAFNQVLRDEFVAAVERATGRRVRSFIGQTSVEPETAVELFLLEPEAA